MTGPKSKNPGTEYISGTISIATNGTDENSMTNIIPVHFTYVTATTSKGAANTTFTTLKEIIEGKMKTVMGSGVAAAAKLRVDSVIGLNEFYTNRNGEDTLVSAIRNEGGFVHTTNNFGKDEDRCSFKTDMIITQVVHKDADDERQLSERVLVRGFVFNFRKELLPVEFVATHPGAINYFENLGATAAKPVFTNVWGRQVSTIVRTTKIEESAFGEDTVREFTSTRKEFLIEHAQKEEYAWDDEATITEEEYTKAKQARETTLADLKSRTEEYRNSTASVPTSKPVTQVAPSTSVDTYEF